MFTIKSRLGLGLVRHCVHDKVKVRIRVMLALSLW